MRQAEERKKTFFFSSKYKREREAKRVRERYVTATAGDGMQEREGYYSSSILSPTFIKCNSYGEIKCVFESVQLRRISVRAGAKVAMGQAGRQAGLAAGQQGTRLYSAVTRLCCTQNSSNLATIFFEIK